MYKKNYFNFERQGNDYLITNDFGSSMFLKPKCFGKLIKNEKLPKNIEADLEFYNFIYFENDNDFIESNYQKLSEYKGYLKESTVLHIFVVSKNCNYSCVYCQAGKLNDGNDFLMSKDTAQKAVDIALQSPSKNLTFEFQGGEPLTNFETIKYIVDYSKEQNKDFKKNIEYIIVSNLSLLTEDMISYIVKNDIYVCTSIDGDKKLQNINRPCSTLDSYEATIDSCKKLLEKEVNLSALLTTTRFSLNETKSIVEEYVKLGLNRICIRPLTNIGKANYNWNKIGYSPEEFLYFYRNILEYIISLNKKGYYLVEGMASIFLAKILKNDAINYMELRSPCGGAIGQMAYYYDGNVFTCDEGRMLFEMGDNKFLIGNVSDFSYKQLINSNITKEMCKSSCLECSHICHSCVYMPYCGTCPVTNYIQGNSLMPYSKNDYRCKINKGILDILFSYIRNDKDVLNVFYSWIL